MTHQVPLVEGGGEEDLGADGGHGAAGKGPVWRRGPEIAAHQHGGVDGPGLGGLERGHGVEPPRLGEVDAEAGFHLLEHVGGQHRLDPDRADALHIGMAAERKEPRIGPPDHAAQKR